MPSPKQSMPSDPRQMLEFRPQYVPMPAPPGGPGAGGKPPSMNVSLRLGPKSLGGGAGQPGQSPELMQMIMQKLQQLPPAVRSMVVQSMMKGRGQQSQPPTPQQPQPQGAPPGV